MVILTIVLGLIIGSFINAVIYRLYSGDSIIAGRSACPDCEEQLRPRDLVPIASFVYLKGQCRYCKKKISWQYPLVEAGTALVFFLFYHKFGLGIELVASLAFASAFIVIGVFDFKHYLILDKVLLPLGIIAIGWNLYGDISSPLHASRLALGILSGLGLAGFFGLQYLISRGRWIGLGDVKLGFVLGNILLWPLSLCMLLLAYFSGALTGIILIAAGKKQLSSKLPFGVFLALSAIITMLWGNEIVAWYRSLIGF